MVRFLNQIKKLHQSFAHEQEGRIPSGHQVFHDHELTILWTQVRLEDELRNNQDKDGDRARKGKLGVDGLISLRQMDLKDAVR